MTGDIMRPVRGNSGRYFLHEQARARRAPGGGTFAPQIAVLSQSLCSWPLCFILGGGSGEGEKSRFCKQKQICVNPLEEFQGQYISF